MTMKSTVNLPEIIFYRLYPDIDFLKYYFQTKTNRCYYLSFYSCPTPICRAKGWLNDRKYEDHIAGQITLYLIPQRLEEAAWCALDIDILDKGQIISDKELNTTYRDYILTIHDSLNSIGLTSNDYWLILNGRGFHVFFFFERFLPGGMVYDFISTIQSLVRTNLTKRSLSFKDIETRPTNPSDKMNCIQIPGYNFRAGRYSIPILIDQHGQITQSVMLPNIKRIDSNTVYQIISKTNDQGGL